MGQDLITVTWATDPTRTIDEDAVRAFIAAIDLDNLTPALDAALGNYGLDEDDSDSIRDRLTEGFEQYKLVRIGHHRYATSLPVPRTGGRPPLWLHTAGGASWGDDPFEGYTDLCVFLEVIDSEDPALQEAAAFAGYGVPTPDLPLGDLTDALAASDLSEIAAQAALLVLTHTTPDRDLLTALATHPDARVQAKVTAIVASAAQE